MRCVVRVRPVQGERTQQQRWIAKNVPRTVRRTSLHFVHVNAHIISATSLQSPEEMPSLPTPPVLLASSRSPVTASDVARPTVRIPNQVVLPNCLSGHTYGSTARPAVGGWEQQREASTPCSRRQAQLERWLSEFVSALQMSVKFSLLFRMLRQTALSKTPPAEEAAGRLLQGQGLLQTRKAKQKALSLKKPKSFRQEEGFFRPECAHNRANSSNPKAEAVRSEDPPPMQKNETFRPSSTR